MSTKHRISEVFLASVILFLVAPGLYLSQWSASLEVSVLIGLLMFFSASRIIGSMVNPKMDCVALSVYVFVYVFFVISAGAQISYRQFPLPGYYGDEDFIHAFFVIFLGLVFFDIGQKIRARFAHSIFQPFVPASGWPNYVLIILILMPLIGLFVFGLYETIFLSRVGRLEATSSVISDTSSALSLLVDAAVRIPFIALMVYFYIRRKRVSFSFLLSSLLALTINNPISSARYMFGFTIIVFLGLLLHQRRHVFRRYFGVAMIFLLLFAFPVLDAWRYDAAVQLSEVGEDAFGVSSVTVNGDYDAYQQLMNLLRYVDSNGYEFGRQLLGALFFWMPRSVWSDKPVATGNEVASSLWYANVNLSMPLWGEFYVDFSYVGVAVGFLALGMLVRALRNLSNQDPRFWAVEVLLSGYMFILLRGSLLSIVSYFGMLVGIMFVANFLSRFDFSRTT